MFVLKGLKVDIYQEYIGGDFKQSETEEKVALFTKKEDAEQYIENSRLKKVQFRTFGHNVVFKSKSLLCNYENAWVEECYGEDLPVDPIL